MVVVAVMVVAVTAAVIIIIITTTSTITNYSGIQGTLTNISYLVFLECGNLVSKEHDPINDVPSNGSYPLVVILLIGPKRWPCH